jgi:hypothetical protein
MSITSAIITKERIYSWIIVQRRLTVDDFSNIFLQNKTGAAAIKFVVKVPVYYAGFSLPFCN